MDGTDVPYDRVDGDGEKCDKYDGPQRDGRRTARVNRLHRGGRTLAYVQRKNDRRWAEKRRDRIRERNGADVKRTPTHTESSPPQLTHLGKQLDGPGTSFVLDRRRRT